MKIGEKEIGGDRCYVIAEIGHNHQGSVQTAEKLIAAAAAAGADAVKFQKRDNKTLFTRQFYAQPYNSEHSFGPTYGQHREALELGRADYQHLMHIADVHGVDFIATAFDIPSADLLVELEIAAIKVCSADADNIPLLRHLQGVFGGALFLSTGGANLAGVRRAVEILGTDADGLCVMQCTAAYPPAYEELNLRVIETYKREFPTTTIGFSSHDNGIAMPIAAYMLGARVIEKHFTLDRTMKGSDHAFSLEPAGLKKMVRDLRRVEAALGDGIKRSYPSEEEPLRKMGKSLYAARDLPAGHVLTAADIAVKSPAGGLSPQHVDDIVGTTLKQPIKEGLAFWAAMHFSKDIAA